MLMEAPVPHNISHLTKDLTASWSEPIHGRKANTNRQRPRRGVGDIGRSSGLGCHIRNRRERVKAAEMGRDEWIRLILSSLVGGGLGTVLKGGRGGVIGALVGALLGGASSPKVRDWASKLFAGASGSVGGSSSTGRSPGSTTQTPQVQVQQPSPEQLQQGDAPVQAQPQVEPTAVPAAEPTAAPADAHGMTTSDYRNLHRYNQLAAERTGIDKDIEAGNIGLNRNKGIGLMGLNFAPEVSGIIAKHLFKAPPAIVNAIGGAALPVEALAEGALDYVGGQPAAQQAGSDIQMLKRLGMISPAGRRTLMGRGAGSKAGLIDRQKEVAQTALSDPSGAHSRTLSEHFPGISSVDDAIQTGVGGLEFATPRFSLAGEIGKRIGATGRAVDLYNKAGPVHGYENLGSAPYVAEATHFAPARAFTEATDREPNSLATALRAGRHPLAALSALTTAPSTLSKTIGRSTNALDLANAAQGRAEGTADIAEQQSGYRYSHPNRVPAYAKRKNPGTTSGRPNWMNLVNWQKAGVTPQAWLANAKKQYSTQPETYQRVLSGQAPSPGAEQNWKLQGLKSIGNTMLPWKQPFENIQTIHSKLKSMF